MTEQSKPKNSRTTSKTGSKRKPRGKSQASTSDDKPLKDYSKAEVSSPEFDKELEEINEEIKEKGVPVMSLFGGIDIGEVPDSIERNAYLTELVEVKYFDLEKKEEDRLLKKGMFVLSFEVIDEDSKYIGETGQLFVNVYKHPGLSMDGKGQVLLDGNPLEKKLQQQIRDAIKFFKVTVQSLGVDPDTAEAGKEFNGVLHEHYYVTMYPEKDTNRTKISGNDPIRKAAEVDEESTDMSDLDI